MKQLKYIMLMLGLVVTLLSGCASAPKPEKSPEQLYADGESAFNKGRYETSVTIWKEVRDSFPDPELAAKAEIGIANAYFLNHDYIEASAAYEEFRKLHPTHDLAQFALYRQALSNYNQITGIDTDQTPTKNTLTLFETFVKQHPKSQYVPRVEEKIAECRAKLAQYEIYIGRFYYRTDKYTSAIGRLEGVLLAHPEYTGHDETLYYLGLSYIESKQQEKMRTVYSRLIREYPSSKYIEDASKLMAKHL